jgi:DNA-binding transcriptional LysR family regulator
MIFRNYKYFLAIAKEKNITRAAESLFISQPSLSKYLKRLESNLEIELFDHSTNPLRLTFAGERYLSYIKEYSDLETRMMREYKDIKSLSRQRLRVGMSPWHASLISATVLPDLLLNNPSLQLDIYEQSHPVLCAMASKGELDFCIVNSPGRYDDVSFEVMIYERILLAVNKESAILKKLGTDTAHGTPPLQPIDLLCFKDEILLMPTKDTTLYPIIENFLHINSIHLTRTANISNRLTALEMVNSGVGAAFIPESAIRFKPAPPHVVFFTLGEPPIAWETGIAYRANSVLDSYARTCADFFKLHFESHYAKSNY